MFVNISIISLLLITTQIIPRKFTVWKQQNEIKTYPHIRDQDCVKFTMGAEDTKCHFELVIYLNFD